MGSGGDVGSADLEGQWGVGVWVDTEVGVWEGVMVVGGAAGREAMGQGERKEMEKGQRVGQGRDW